MSFLHRCYMGAAKSSSRIEQDHWENIRIKNTVIFGVLTSAISASLFFFRSLRSKIARLETNQWKPRGNNIRHIPVLVELEGSNNDIARVNADGRCRAIDLVTVDTVYVNDPLFTVNLGDLSISSLVFSPHN
jgi:hypothetical protein